MEPWNMFKTQKRNDEMVTLTAAEKTAKFSRQDWTEALICDDHTSHTKNKGVLYTMIARCISAILLFVLTVPAYSQVPSPRVRPEVVNYSEYLSDADFDLFRRGLDAAEDEDWDEVSTLRQQLSNTVARNVLLWRTALNNPRATFLELNLALTELDNWPRDSFIRSEAEAKITDSGLSAPFIIAWFDANPATTGRGRMALAQALMDDGQTEAGESLMRETWRTGRLALPVQRRIYRANQDLFSDEDHFARIDYLIWSGQRTAARRILPLLSGNQRNLADARLRLAGRQRGVDGAVRRIPASLSNDAGLVYERARWRRRSGLRDTVLPLLLQLPDSHTDANALDLMWTERKLMILTLIRDQEYADAYELAAAHGMSRGGDFADAEFMAGWLSLVHLDQAQRAMDHFTRLNDNVSMTVSLSRASYWMARAADALGQPELAAQHYETAGGHSTAYYGQLALAELADNDIANLSFAPDPEPSDEVRIGFEARPQVQALRLLAEQGEDYFFRLFIYRLDDQMMDPSEAVLLAGLAEDYLYRRQAVRAAKAARQRGIVLPQSAYPTIELPQQVAMAPEDALVLSVIRQETEFSQRAVSGAGARGMMQLMPGTARQTARALGEPYRNNWLTDDLQYNLTLGMSHLGEVVEDYDGSYIVALAAYNAGGHRARRWIQDYGDPRDPDVDPIDWVESIPFSETRNYVMRVMENLQVYRTRLQDDAAVPLMIDADLLRGADLPPVAAPPSSGPAGPSLGLVLSPDEITPAAETTPPNPAG
jgi:soluble lytic murein transglycosylase